MRRGGHLEQLFFDLKHGTEYLNYGREIITQWVAKCVASVSPEEEVKILDIGCGGGY